MGRIAKIRQERAIARDLFERCLVIWRELGVEGEIADVLNALAELESTQN